ASVVYKRPARGAAKERPTPRVAGGAPPPQSRRAQAAPPERPLYSSQEQRTRASQRPPVVDIDPTAWISRLFSR
ncbi:hypothetical protein, partial [Rhodopseudomonas sp. BAL398]|uniref:hypothetical protein n=1 Tax=Rhodopseudomonas sp. BAL398 TaxID=3034676 RepID=UPI0023E32B65